MDCCLSILVLLELSFANPVLRGWDGSRSGRRWNEDTTQCRPGYDYGYGQLLIQLIHPPLSGIMPGLPVDRYQLNRPIFSRHEHIHAPELLETESTRRGMRPDAAMEETSHCCCIPVLSGSLDWDTDRIEWNHR
jgi:hypothetical protein